MISSRIMTTILAVCLFAIWLVPPAHADELRNLQRGEPMPAFKLVTMGGELIAYEPGSELISSSETYEGTVFVMVYLAAEQRSSELAAMGASTVVSQFSDEPVKLIFVTADVVRRAYFQRFFEERELDAPLALDADRSLYAKLGLIVFPTTIIIDRAGKLAHVISIHSPDYKHVLDSNIRHVLELIDDEQLRERLEARPSSEGSPRSRASAHRTLARLMREQGRLEAARDELVKSRELDPDNIETLLDLAEIDVARNDLEGAQELIVAVLKENAGHRRAKQIRGIILYRSGRLVEAERVLLDALNLHPDPARIQYYLGRIYEQQGEKVKAMEHYRRALERFLHETEPADSSSQ